MSQEVAAYIGIVFVAIGTILSLLARNGTFDGLDQEHQEAVDVLAIGLIGLGTMIGVGGQIQTFSGRHFAVALVVLAAFVAGVAFFYFFFPARLSKRRAGHSAEQAAGDQGIQDPKPVATSAGDDDGPAEKEHDAEKSSSDIG